MRQAVIIPAYNEEITIAGTITAFHQQLPEAEIVVVDNNSADRTQQIARQTLASLRSKGRVLFVRRQGKGNAVRHAFADVDADLYIMVDADQTYSAGDVHKLIEPVINRGMDMVVGDRLSRGQYLGTNVRRFHNIGNIIVRATINLLFRSRLRDIMSGYRVFNRRFVKNFPVLSEGFEIETEMTLHALHKRFTIEEVPVEYQSRPSGSFSKLNTLKDGYNVLKTIFWIFKDFHPFPFFFTLAILFGLSGVVIGIPPVLEYWAESYVYKVPSAILATGLMIFALLSFSIGLILDTVAKFQRFNYALQLLRYDTENRTPSGAAQSAVPGI